MTATDLFSDMPDDVGGLSPTSGEVPIEQQAQALYVETCPKCKGSGMWQGGYVNPTTRPCFSCNGAGTVTYKTSLAYRQERTKAKADPANVKARLERITADANKRQATQLAFRTKHAAEWAWMERNADGFEFARSCKDALARSGKLSDGQLQGIQKCLARDVARSEQRLAEAQQRAAVAPTVDVARIVKSFEHARSRDIKRPKVRLDTFKFARAPDTGRNAGAIYVTDSESDDDTYLGKIVNGKFLRVAPCTDDQERRIVFAASNPLEAAIAYGQRTGECSVCGRTLTNHTSIDLGIGPICRGNMGW